MSYKSVSKLGLLKMGLQYAADRVEFKMFTKPKYDKSIGAAQHLATFGYFPVVGEMLGWVF